MSYSDDRTLEDKLEEHRTWNTLELEIDSAAGAISAQLLSAIEVLAGGSVDKAHFCEALKKACDDEDQQLAEGLVRIGVLCSNETPNRFKALFPAYLLQEGYASPDKDKMRWCGLPRLSSRTVTVETLVKCILAGTGDELAREHFAQWIDEKDGFTSLSEICRPMPLPRSFIYSISLRLAQGADTNRRGHSATDIIKERLEDYGFSPDLGNTNASDVAATLIVDNYSGPRKFDTVIWNARGDVVLVCQSQMYSSDVGSIQGKTVEEDYEAVSKLKEKWNGLVSLTNTEGFGCHTTMLSRLKHVLNSRIDGYIQLRTLDTKLRAILRKLGCVSLVDFEKAILSTPSQIALVSDLFASPSLVPHFEREELEKGLTFYTEKGLLLTEGSEVSLRKDRLASATYYQFLDELWEACIPIDEIVGEHVRLGGLPVESGIPHAEFGEMLDRLVGDAGLEGEQLRQFHEKVAGSQCIEQD